MIRRTEDARPCPPGDPGEPSERGAGGTEGRASGDPQQMPQDVESPKEVQSIPIGVPDDPDRFRRMKERAREASDPERPRRPENER